MEDVRTLRPNWHQGRQLAYDAAGQVPPRTLPVSECLGAELLEPVVAEAGLPHYDSAAMDGWAVAGSAPWIAVEAGSNQEARIFPGQAQPIVTGGPVPAGAHAVLRSESGKLATDADGLPQVELSETAKPGEPRRNQHIRRVGEEAPAGTVVCEPGVRLNPAHLALAAATGYDALSVAGQVRMHLIYTGSEVITKGVPGPGQVRDAFGVQLAATAAMCGATVTGEQRLPDSREDLVEALASPADVVVTTGGTGHSDADHVRAALNQLDAELVVDGIAIRPGGPSLLARLPSGTLVVGLPGNPLAAFVGFALLAQPLMAALRGLALPEVAQMPSGSVIKPFEGTSKILPFREVLGMAAPLEHAGAGMLRGLAQSAGLMIVPPHGAQLGENVPTLTLPWQRPQL